MSVPRLSREFIEQKAEAVLRWIRPAIVNRPSLTPVAEIAERLKIEHDLQINLDYDLGNSERGKKIFGMCQFRPNIIYIDRNLDPNGPRFRFTLAHELGHLVLHRKLFFDPAELDIPQNQIPDDRTHLLSGRRKNMTPRDWLEWQANAFASAILMPRRTLKAAVLELQTRLAIRRPGIIFVDDQPTNVVAYQTVISELKDVYQVSRTALEIRLKDLEILYDRRTFGRPVKLFREA